MENKFLEVFATDEGQDILQLATADLKTSDGCAFPVHKVILARKNEHFRKVFCYPDAKDKREFLIPGVSGEILSEILIYLYTGKYSCIENNIAELIMGADYLCVNALIKEIHENYKDKINVSNCLPLLFHSHHVNSDEMFKEVLRFTQLNFDTVVYYHKPLFAELPLELLTTILCSKNLHVPDERPIWLAIVEWVLKDLQYRLPFVSLLLKHLANKEVDEALAKEIVSHNIVKNNSYCKNSSDCESGQYLQNFLTMTPDSCFDYRIPSKLYIIAKRVKFGDFNEGHVYVTHDEELDLWRKVAHVSFDPDWMVLSNNNVYMFSYKGECSKLNLKENNLIYINHFLQQNITYLHVAKHERFIYVFGTQDNEPNVQVLDPETNLWRNGAPYLNFDSVIAASIFGKIYIVGRCHQTREAMVQVYDPELDAWSHLSSSTLPFPNIDCVVHRERFFVIGGTGPDHLRTVVIFDPKTDNWRQVADIPIFDCLKDVLVFNDRLFVVWGYDHSDPGYTKTKLAWNENLECWDENDEYLPLLNIDAYTFCEEKDTETVKIISKGEQFRNIKLESSDFNSVSKKLPHDNLTVL